MLSVKGFQLYSGVIYYTVPLSSTTHAIGYIITQTRFWIQRYTASASSSEKTFKLQVFELLDLKSTSSDTGQTGPGTAST